MEQSTSKILMVRPANFGFNPQTAVSNVFQKAGEMDAAEVAELAAQEFEAMVESLRDLNVEVIVADDTPGVETPDSVFPNNVFSTHRDGTICIYPMEAPARRLERAVINQVLLHINDPKTFRLSHYEQDGMFLEGTGSLVLDRINKIAFACVSSRTHPALVELWSDKMGYEPHMFTALDSDGKPIYHTNVMMCMATEFAVACSETIADENEKAKFIRKIHQTGRELIEISVEQMYSFAGNMLEIASRDGDRIIAMSETARASLTKDQIQKLEDYCRIASFGIDTIEQFGGGSVRCMIAEVF